MQHYNNPIRHVSQGPLLQHNSAIQGRLRGGSSESSQVKASQIIAPDALECEREMRRRGLLTAVAGIASFPVSAGNHVFEGEGEIGSAWLNDFLRSLFRAVVAATVSRRSDGPLG